MDKHSIAERVQAVAKQVAGDTATELVHVDVAGTTRDLVVRIFIDKDGGVTLDNCSEFSRSVEEVLDADDVIPVRYVLEVSSPGIERELYSLADFEKFKGRLAKIKTREAVDGQKTFVGTITRTDNGKIEFEDRTKGAMAFEYADIEKANLKIDLSKEFSSRR